MDPFLILVSGYAINPNSVDHIDFRNPTAYVHIAGNVITCGEEDSAMLRSEFFPKDKVNAAKADYAKGKKDAAKASAATPTKPAE